VLATYKTPFSKPFNFFSPLPFHVFWHGGFFPFSSFFTYLCQNRLSPVPLLLCSVLAIVPLSSLSLAKPLHPLLFTYAIYFRCLFGPNPLQHPFFFMSLFSCSPLDERKPLFKSPPHKLGLSELLKTNSPFSSPSPSPATSSPKADSP